MIFESISKTEHEEVVFCHNKDAGLKAIIAIHNTVLGPALGGTRMWPYASEQEALNDVLRLSGETHATGGAGADVFEMAVGGTSVIADYDGREDRLVVVYDPMEGQEEPEVSLQVDGADALILMDGQVLARV